MSLSPSYSSESFEGEPTRKHYTQPQLATDRAENSLYICNT